MSRKHNRKEFRTDLLLLRNNLEAEKTACPNKFLTFMFLGVYNKSMLEEQFVEVEIVLSKISHMKRKDSIKATQDAVSFFCFVLHFNCPFMQNKSKNNEK